MISIVAHRGAPTYAHENTLASFLKAVELGADMVEFDIRRTQDKKLVVFHDPFILSENKALHLNSLNYTDLSAIAATKGFIIPLLDEVLEALAGKTTLNVEIKEPGYESEIAERALHFFDPKTFVIQSFLAEASAAVKQKYPFITTGLLIGKEESILRIDYSIFDFLAIEKAIYLQNRDFYISFKSEKRKIAIWTVDRPEDIDLFLRDQAIDALITNRCDLALSIQETVQVDRNIRGSLFFANV